MVLNNESSSILIVFFDLLIVAIENKNFHVVVLYSLLNSCRFLMELLSLKVAKHNCYFFLTAFKNEQRLCPPGYFHFTADIETKCEKVYQSSQQDVFPVQSNFPIEKWENLGFLLFKE